MGSGDDKIAGIGSQLRDQLGAGLPPIEPVAVELLGGTQDSGVGCGSFPVRAELRRAVHDGGAGGTSRGADPASVGRHRNECGGISEVRKGCEVTDHTPLQLHGEHRCRRGVEERTEIHRRSFAHSARTI